MEVLDLSMRKKCCPLIRSPGTSDKVTLSPLHTSFSSSTTTSPPLSPESLHLHATSNNQLISSVTSDDIVLNHHSKYSSVKSTGNRNHKKCSRDNDQVNKASDDDDVDDDDDDEVDDDDHDVNGVGDDDEDVENEIKSLMTVTVASPAQSTVSSSSSPITRKSDRNTKSIKPVKSEINSLDMTDQVNRGDYFHDDDNSSKKLNQRLQQHHQQLLKQHHHVKSKLRQCSVNKGENDKISVQDDKLVVDDDEDVDDDNLHSDTIKCSNGSQSKYIHSDVQSSKSDRTSIKLSTSHLSSLKLPASVIPTLSPVISSPLSSTVNSSTFSSLFHSPVHLQQRMKDLSTSQQLAAAAAFTQLLSNSGLISPHVLSSVNAVSLVNQLTANNSQNHLQHQHRVYDCNGTVVNSNSSSISSSSSSPSSHSSSSHQSRHHQVRNSSCSSSSSSSIVNCSSPSTQQQQVTLTPFDGNLLSSLPWDLLTTTWRNHNWHNFSPLNLPQHSPHETLIKCKTNATGNFILFFLFFSSLSAASLFSHLIDRHEVNFSCTYSLTYLLTLTHPFIKHTTF